MSALIANQNNNSLKWEFVGTNKKTKKSPDRNNNEKQQASKLKIPTLEPARIHILKNKLQLLI